MYLYNLTLQSSNFITQSIVGNFSGNKAQEVIVAKNSILEMYRPDVNTGQMVPIINQHVFGVIRCLCPFRLPGGSKDYIIAGSDSGGIAILEYDIEKNMFQRVQFEIFGKTGCRRTVPGQYLAADPRGRAVMIGAIEKQKLVYILNRDSQAKLTINSPLEAHKNQTICFHLVGLDVGYENPIFAALEVDYSEAEQDKTAYQNVEKVNLKLFMEKHLVYYELDLGLNHVTRKWSEKVDRTSNYLIALPGGVDGPSGVLVCSENKIVWVHEGYPSLSVPIPRRAKELEQNQNGEETKEGILIVNSVVHKLKKTFFILAQTEQGDLFKITVDYESQNADGTGASGVQNLKVKYFDTIPVAHSLSILKTGFLFAAAEFGNNHFYQIENLGDDEEDQPEYQSADFSQEAFDISVLVPFQPRALRNLSVVDEIQSFAPFIDATFLTPKNDDIPILYALSGRGANSSIKVFQLGLEISEIAVSELPGTPTAIWTVKLSITDEYHSYIVVSFVNATLVLSIGETVEEVTDSGILGSVSTLLVNQIGNDALVQVYKSGIRHISADKRVREWKVPAGKTIVKAASNRRQVVIALSSAELIYFELDSAGNLNEFQERREMGAPVASLTLGPIPEGRLRSRYMAAGLTDNTVRLLALDPESCLQSLGMQALNAIPESVCLTYINEKSTGKIPTIPNLYLYVGLQSGVLIRSSMDEVTGALTDTRMKFLGTKPVRLFPIRTGDTDTHNSMLALSSKTWLAYTWQARNRLLPISYEGLEFAADFASEPCPQGIVAIAGNTLRILSIEKLGSVFQQSSIPLTYTPRRFAIHPDTQQFLVIESEYGALCPSEKQKIEEDSMDMDEQALDPSQFGYQKANGKGKWASLIRLLNPFTGENLALFQLNENEAAFSVCICRFNTDPSAVYAVVGTAKDLVMTPRSFSGAYLRVYRFSEDGTDLELIHSTPIEDVPYTLCPFQGRLLVSVGKVLRMYELGKKKLLRKCENKCFTSRLSHIETQGNRVIVSDSQDSIHYLQYKPADNKLVLFADDSLSRHVTSFTMVDYTTVIGGDKFGNLFGLRLPADATDVIEDDPTGTKLFDIGYLNGANHRLNRMVEFHVGETIVHLSKVAFTPGGREVVVYVTFLGTIGLLIPFVTKDDLEFFQGLEINMRQEHAPILGMSHMLYRGCYAPVKGAIDGDLCEQYLTLSLEKRRTIAEQLERTASEVMKKLEDIRSRSAF